MNNAYTIKRYNRTIETMPFSFDLTSASTHAIVLGKPKAKLFLTLVFNYQDAKHKPCLSKLQSWLEDYPFLTLRLLPSIEGDASEFAARLALRGFSMGVEPFFRCRNAIIHRSEQGLLAFLQEEHWNSQEFLRSMVTSNIDRSLACADMWLRSAKCAAPLAVFHLPRGRKPCALWKGELPTEEIEAALHTVSQTQKVAA